MRKLIATAIAGALVPFAFAAPAAGVRPIPGFDYPDVCANIEGTQTILSVVSGFYAFKVRTPQVDDCRLGYRSRVKGKRR